MKTNSTNHTIAQNKKAHFDYTLEDEYIAGIVLEGWEVKSIRAGKVNIADSHILLKHGEAFLLGSHIQTLSTTSTISGPDPTRTRKLLLQRRELNRLLGSVERHGYTLIPLTLFWQHNHVKIKFSLAKGKKAYDKRATVKDREWQRQREQIFKK